MTGAFSGGSQDAHADISVETDMSASDMADHLERQLRDQRWTLDARFRGDVSSGHVWQRRAEGMNLSCTVTVFDGGEQLRLRMHVEPF